MSKVSVLFADPKGVYSTLPGIDLWDEAKDARKYTGPNPVVAHPPCQRWGRFWHGSTRKPHQYRLGEDMGCFAAALTAVRNYGGVLEHPADSQAWEYFGLRLPLQWLKRWQPCDQYGGATTWVEQGQYGHMSNKRTWLYSVGCTMPDLNWTRGGQRLPQSMIDRYGYEKARRIGVVAMIGGKDKTRIRNATPVRFAKLLVSIATSAVIK